jgi:hypothetical protein
MERSFRRSRALGLRFVALSLVGVCLGAACSDDEGNPSSSLAGGAGGEPQSSGGEKPIAGTKAASGTGGMPDSMGEGGRGGEPHVPALGEQCRACADSECEDLSKACNDSPECAEWLTCVSACVDGSCVSACDATHADVARVSAGVYDCLCDSCEEACGEAGACEKKTCVDDGELPTITKAPATLAETGLYAIEGNLGAGGAGGAGGASGVELVMPVAIADYVKTFEPKYPLWADDATKQRYVYVPKCKTIDTSDMDHWKFPVGTRFWKTFSVGEKVVETRLMHHFGPGEADWLFAAYQWDPNQPDDPSAALWTQDLLVANANGTTHDIPSTGACTNCHAKLSERVLGFGAIQLSHEGATGGLTIGKLSGLGWLTQPAPDGFEVPGDALQRAALGYLHGNCGGCHNQGAGIPASPPLVLRLLVGQKDYATTDTVTSTVGVGVVSGLTEIAGKHRVEPMDPAASALLIRMSYRGTSGLQMPPANTNATKQPDTTGGVKVITDWVNSIPK